MSPEQEPQADAPSNAPSNAASISALHMQNTENRIRTDAEPPTDERPSDPSRRTRESDESDSDSHTPVHPSQRLAHHRKPEIQRLRAILLSAGAKIPKEAQIRPEIECSCYKLPRAEDGVLRHHPDCPNIKAGDR